MGPSSAPASRSAQLTVPVWSSSCLCPARRAHGQLAVPMLSSPCPCQACHAHSHLAMPMPCLPCPARHAHAQPAMSIPSLPCPCQARCACAHARHVHAHAQLVMPMPSSPCPAHVPALAQPRSVAFALCCDVRHITSRSPRELPIAAALEEGKCFNLSSICVLIFANRGTFPAGLAPRCDPAGEGSAAVKAEGSLGFPVPRLVKRG